MYGTDIYTWLEICNSHPLHGSSRLKSNPYETEILINVQKITSEVCSQFVCVFLVCLIFYVTVMPLQLFPPSTIVYSSDFPCLGTSPCVHWPTAPYSWNTASLILRHCSTSGTAEKHFNQNTENSSSEQNKLCIQLPLIYISKEQNEFIQYA